MGRLSITTLLSLYTCLSLCSQPASAVRFDDRAHRRGPQRSVALLRTGPERCLQVRAGAPFRVALFADLHFGEDAWTQWGPRQDLNSVRVISNVLAHETPDFVVYLGDVITANNIGVANASLYWDQAISPTRDRGIPWASVFGNHDDAAFEWPIEWFSAPGIPQLRCPGEEDCSFKGTSRLDLIKNEIRHNALSHTRNGPEELWPSVSNYVLKLSSSEDLIHPWHFSTFWTLVAVHIQKLYQVLKQSGSTPQLEKSTRIQGCLR